MDLLKITCNCCGSDGHKCAVAIVPEGLPQVRCLMGEIRREIWGSQEDCRAVAI